MRVTPARDIKRAYPGQRLMTWVLRQSGSHLSEVGSGGEIRSPQGGPRRSTHGCPPWMPTTALPPQTSQPHPSLTAMRQSCVPPRDWRSQTRPQPSVREPRAVSGLRPPARKEETQESSPLLPPTAPFHHLGDFLVALGQQPSCATRLGPKHCEKQMCTRFRG